MRKLAVILAVLASAAVAGAQSRAASAWLYPADARRDPMQAPEELYRSASRASLRVEAVIISPPRSRALVRLGGAGPYAVVGAGDRLGDYQIARIGPNGVTAVLTALGAERSVSVAADTVRKSNP